MIFVLDTNAYRVLVYGKTIEEVVALADRMKKLESVAGHSSQQSTVVAMELIKHLPDGDPAKEECYKALVCHVAAELIHEKNEMREDTEKFLATNKADPQRQCVALFERIQHKF